MQDFKLIQVKEGILAENDRQAEAIRERLRRAGTLLVNLMASPGSGKTSLILKTVQALGADCRTGVIEADIDSSLDAQQVASAGIRVAQLQTGGLCHLDASMVDQGLEALGEQDLDLIFLENVGNLVCPAEFDTGAHLNVMILSVPEGDDKPLKYPLMFRSCRALVVNKTDYLELAEFDLELLRQRIEKLNPDMGTFPVSCRTGEGVEAWTAWLKGQVRALKE